MENIIKKYFKSLEIGELSETLRLFSDDAVVISPLYGRLSAKEFYSALFQDTSASTLTVLHILKNDKEKVMAGHFKYEWEMKNGKVVSFEGVDIFEMDETEKIKQLTIIYDTQATRTAFEKL